MKLLSRIEATLGTRVHQLNPISGGDINEARRVHTDRGDYFLKYNERPEAEEMFRAEVAGLDLLRGTEGIRIPEIVALSDDKTPAFLLLEFVDAVRPTQAGLKAFGRGLAALHRRNHETFGGNPANFIGRLPQSNYPHASWPQFFANERLLPQMRSAVSSGQLSIRWEAALNKLIARLPELCPEESPALTHGDLWSGNYLFDAQQRPVLIDPAVAWQHREMDLGMLALFGDPGGAFWKAYREAYPTAPGLHDRLPIYQLYYLLVHVNLFGGSYVASVERILGRFA